MKTESSLGTTIPNAHVVRLGRRDVLVSMPNCRQYGHQALEIALAFAEARRLGVAVHFVQPPHMTNPAMFDFEPDGVEVMEASFLTRGWLDSTMRWGSGGLFGKRWKKKVSTRMKEFKRDFHGEVRYRLKDDSLSGSMRLRLKRWDVAVEAWVSGSGNADGVLKPYYYNRRLLREPVSVRLREGALVRARRQAKAIGLDDEVPIATLHMREAGYKLGRELQDSKPDRGRDDSVRNVRVESYFEAVDWLVRQGYVVVRIGDPSMVPFSRQGVIDLATSSHRSSLLESYCVWRSRFLLGCDSGPTYLCYLTDTPIACVNCTAPIATYPIRSNGLYILKSMSVRNSGMPLGLAQLAASEDPIYFRDSTTYQYHDNTPEEILETVKEMVGLLDSPTAPSPAQVRYDELLTNTDRRLRPIMDYVRKWGADDGFMGDGRIGRFFVERHNGSDLESRQEIVL